jgi:plastocyanin
LIRASPSGVETVVSTRSIRRLTAALAALLVFGAAPAGATGGARVTIKNIDFHPATVTVHRGGSVTWTFADHYVSHNVTSRGRLRFRSSPTKASGTYTVRFAKQGTYAYVCTIHANMRGHVVVR